MEERLPSSALEAIGWNWAQFEPHYRRLLETEVSPETLDGFLLGWTRLSEIVREVQERLQVAKTVNTADLEAETRFNRYLDEIYPPSRAAEQKLKEKLLASGLSPEGFETPLRKMRAQAELFREENVSLLAREQKLVTEYDSIVGAQTVSWNGKEIPLAQVRPLYQDPDRKIREDAWRLASDRQLDDREALNDLWGHLLALRREIAQNAGLPDYREYRWRQLLRFDYRPDDNLRLHEAVRKVVVPAAERRHADRRRQSGITTLRPWDLNFDPAGRAPLRPFVDTTRLEQGVAAMFHRLDPELGRHFDTMIEGSLLDLSSRKNKAPGGYCTTFQAAHEPFIFMNAAGIHDDVQTLLHESGHAFHVFEMTHLPYLQQRDIGMEFAEVASMSMELLAAPHLSSDRGGFYTIEDAARARLQHLEHILHLWVRLSVADAFQHWVYTHPDEAGNPGACDQEWARLSGEYMPSIDWTGLEPQLQTGWHRVLHIFVVPFYIVEYALAQLAAVQIWAQAREDQRAAVARYRRALSLGGTRSLPDLYRAVGATFDFGEAAFRPAVDLIEEVVAELGTQIVA